MPKALYLFLSFFSPTCLHVKWFRALGHFGCSWVSLTSLSPFARHGQPVLWPCRPWLSRSAGDTQVLCHGRATRPSAGLLHSISVSSLTGFGIKDTPQGTGLSRGRRKNPPDGAGMKSYSSGTSAHVHGRHGSFSSNKYLSLFLGKI